MIQFKIDDKLWFGWVEAPRGKYVEVRDVWRREGRTIIRKFGNLGGVPREDIREA